MNLVAVARRLQPLPWLLLTVVWILWWSELSWGNLVAGVLVGGAILLLFPLPPLSLGVRVRPVALLVLVLRFLLDLILASLQVAYKAVVPWVRPQGRLLRIRLRSEQDLFCVITAEMTALVPGTVVVDVHPPTRELFIHVFDAPTEAVLDLAAQRVLAQEERVLRALAAHYRDIMGGREEGAAKRRGAQPAAPGQEES